MSFINYLDIVNQKLLRFVLRKIFMMTFTHMLLMLLLAKSTIVEAEQPIFITRQPQNLTVVAGQNHTLFCEFNSGVHCEWRRDGIPITIDPKSRYFLFRGQTKKTSDCSLAITNVQLQDRGSWLCRGTDGQHSDSREAQLKIASFTALPKITLDDIFIEQLIITPQNMSRVNNLSCSLEIPADLTPRLWWELNGTSVSDPNLVSSNLKQSSNSTLWSIRFEHHESFRSTLLRCIGDVNGLQQSSQDLVVIHRNNNIIRNNDDQPVVFGWILWLCVAVVSCIFLAVIISFIVSYRYKGPRRPSPSVDAQVSETQSNCKTSKQEPVIYQRRNSLYGQSSSIDLRNRQILEPAVKSSSLIKNNEIQKSVSNQICHNGPQYSISDMSGGTNGMPSRERSSNIPLTDILDLYNNGESLYIDGTTLCPCVDSHTQNLSLSRHGNNLRYVPQDNQGRIYQQQCLGAVKDATILCQECSEVDGISR